MAVNTSKVTSAATNGNVEILPNGTGKVRLTQNAGLGNQPVAVDNVGDVKNLRIKDLTVDPSGGPLAADSLMIDRDADTQVRKITVANLAAAVGGLLGGVTAQPGTPPSPAVAGDLWYNTAAEDARLYVYYGPDGGGTTQWVDTSPSADIGQTGTTGMNFPAGAAGATYQAPNGVLYTWNATYTAWQGEGGGGASVEIGITPPASPSQGDMWWNPAEDDGRLYIYYGPDSGGTSQWVPATPPVGSGGGGTSIVIGADGATLESGMYAVVPSAGMTLNLPASPEPGAALTIVVAGEFTDTVVAGGGENIMGLAEDITLDKNYAAMDFTYVDTTNGWRLS